LNLGISTSRNVRNIFSLQIIQLLSLCHSIAKQKTQTLNYFGYPWKQKEALGSDHYKNGVKVGGTFSSKVRCGLIFIVQ
jgi:hypothetical protein